MKLSEHLCWRLAEKLINKSRREKFKIVQIEKEKENIMHKIIDLLPATIFRM